jgi:sec-independent protein translocase protein TatB
MFFDIGWPEFMVIGIVALVVIGPKDLPAALRVAGYWVRKARTLSREFHGSIEQMMREVELHEVQNELKKATEFDLDREFQKIVDPVNDPAAGPQPPREIPDYVDTTPAPADPLAADPLHSPVAEAQAAALEEEPELPLPMPTPLPVSRGEPEPARAAEPSKP